MVNSNAVADDFRMGNDNRNRATDRSSSKQSFSLLPNLTMPVRTLSNLDRDEDAGSSADNKLASLEGRPISK